MRHVSFIHRDGAGYGVSFPDFPGCVSVGVPGERGTPRDRGDVTEAPRDVRDGS